MCSSQLYVMSTVNTATEYLQSSVSLWNTDSTPFSANDCILGKKMGRKRSLRFCTKDPADMCCQPAQGLTPPPSPHYKSDNVTVARCCPLWEIQIRDNPALPLPRRSTTESAADEMEHSGLSRVPQIDVAADGDSDSACYRPQEHSIKCMYTH